MDNGVRLVGVVIDYLVVISCSRQGNSGDRQAYLEEGNIMMCAYREIGTNILVQGWFLPGEKLSSRDTQIL